MGLLFSHCTTYGSSLSERTIIMSWPVETPVFPCRGCAIEFHICNRAAYQCAVTFSWRLKWAIVITLHQAIYRLVHNFWVPQEMVTERSEGLYQAEERKPCTNLFITWFKATTCTVIGPLNDTLLPWWKVISPSQTQLIWSMLLSFVWGVNHVIIWKFCSKLTWSKSIVKCNVVFLLFFFQISFKAENLCSICCERVKSAFLSCGYTFCMVCATHLQEITSTLMCPICPLWTIHNGVCDAPTVYNLTWPHFTVKVLTIYCIQRQYLSF